MSLRSQNGNKARLSFYSQSLHSSPKEPLVELKTVNPNLIQLGFCVQIFFSTEAVCAFTSWFHSRVLSYALKPGAKGGRAQSV